MSGKITVAEIRGRKGRGSITAVTAVDYATGVWCRRAGIDIALVGDSLAMVVFGDETTTEVTVEEMARATRAVNRGMEAEGKKEGSAPRPLLVADIPLSGLDDPVSSARRLIDSGADAVKIECHELGGSALREIREAGIEVMAHVGLLPQEIERLGNYKVRGRTPEESERIFETARDAEERGAFSCVVEKVPVGIGERLTEILGIPTIGIGAGPNCDGQILVLYDLLGMFDRFRPRFVRRYADLSTEAVEALRKYAADVRAGRFPGEKESFH
ncbi:MAG: 3-methyl-2-oxobutanoate hydroxymethyltransferase [Candidatus Hydrogenedentota bacterium]|nr:MAG: 3-methyl-2-oxobutanoate hydroxymethyltransferase [Candidatus Hydrogenedentota bacterium]